MRRSVYPSVVPPPCSPGGETEREREESIALGYKDRLMDLLLFVESRFLEDGFPFDS